MSKLLPKTLVLLGPPGSGKDTQAFALAKRFGYFVLVTGDLFRAKANEDTDLGRKIAGFLARGGLVPSGLVTAAVSEELDRHTSTIQAVGLLLNGFPRNEEESLDCEKLIDSRHLRPDLAVYLNVDDQALVARLLARGREDDTPEVIQRRITVYHQETAPILSHYRKSQKLVEVDGSPPIEHVTQNILTALEQYYP